jgi:hypothetical protein
MWRCQIGLPLLVMSKAVCCFLSLSRLIDVGFRHSGILHGSFKLQLYFFHISGGAGTGDVAGVILL